MSFLLAPVARLAPAMSARLIVASNLVVDSCARRCKAVSDTKPNKSCILT